MHAAGVVEIETHDDVVLTDVAREKAIALGMHLKPVATTDDGRQGPGLPRMAVAAGTTNASRRRCRYEPDRCAIGITRPIPVNHRCRSHRPGHEDQIGCRGPVGHRQIQ